MPREMPLVSSSASSYTVSWETCVYVWMTELMSRDQEREKAGRGDG